MKHTLAFLLLVLFVSAAWGQTLPPRKYPSLRTGVVLPGEYAAPTDQEARDWLLSLYGSATANDVARFEAERFDISSGSGMPTQFRDRIITLAYAYFQILSNSVRADIALRQYCISQGWDWEDMYLHFKEDTYFDSREVTATETIFDGKGLQMVYQTSSSSFGVWVSITSPQDVFAGSNQGGGLCFLVPERVDQITFEQLAQGGDPGPNGQLIVEYTNSVDSQGRANGWGQVTIVQDTTNGLRQPGTIRWIPPTDWKWAAAGVAPVPGLVYLSPAAGYLLRIRTVNYTTVPRLASGSNAATFPIRFKRIVTVETTSLRTGQVISATSNTVTINNRNLSRASNYYKDMTIEIVSGQGAGQTRTITASDSGANPRLTVSPNWDVIPNNTSVYRITGPTVKVLGWDPANDRNGDGYVDDSEFANLTNPNATAQFRWEARVKRGTEQWSSSSSSCRPNLWNPNYRQLLVGYYIPFWQSQNIKGYYNDDATALLEYDRFPTLGGGRILERQGGPVGIDTQMNLDYRDAFLAIHQAFRNAGVEWISTNISNGNYWMESFARPYIGSFTMFLCEDTIWDCMPYAEASLGVARRAWVLSGYARAGVFPLVMGQKNRFGGGTISLWGGTREGWEYATMSQLAQYYLINVPDKMGFQFWNGTFWYGSRLTEQSTGTGWYAYYKAGVPTNMAYTPHKVLEVDIGDPTGTIPEGYEVLHYLENDYPGTVIGRSTDNYVTLPSQGNLRVDVYPTHIFYLWRSANNWRTVPAEAVLARQYTKGLVLYRATAAHITNNNQLRQYVSPESAITVQLPGGPYRRVNYDGTLGPPVNEIQIRGYEGIVLVKAAQTTNPNIQLTMSVDKTNPRPMDVVTVTIQANNTGNANASNVELRVPLGSMTYEQGSLTPQGYQVDTSEQGVLKINIPSVAAGETKTVQFRLVQR